MNPPDPTPRPIDHILLSGADDAPALVTKSVTLTYAQAEHAVGALAATLRDRVPERGARVATWLPKTIEACLMPLAAVRAGLIHVPINPVLRRAQVAHILADSGAKLLLTHEERASALVPGDLPHDCTLWFDDAAGAARAHAEVVSPSSASPDTLAALLYTSGSTGQPKGVMLSHANLWLGAVSVAHFLGLDATDRTLSLLPLGFDYGQNQLFSTWRAGGCVIPLDYLLPREVVKAIAREAITTLAAVPPLWLQLVEQDWGIAGHSVRRLTNSGGALTPSLIKAIRGAFPKAAIFPMYGLTEAFRSTYLHPSLVAAHPSSIGKSIPFAEVMIVDSNGNESDTGELVHAGPLVAQGYWNDPDRTKARFRPAPSQSRRGGFAVWSGDTVHKDANGLLYFVGRDDEMIKSSGHRISPLEVEHAAIASGIATAAVAIGVPDARLGQAIVLVTTGRRDEQGLRTYLKRELPGYMQPRDFVWLEAMPTNANGKFDRAALRTTVTE